jgi:hypothetical protein
LVFKKNCEEEKTSDDETPKVQDFNLDPEYRKFVLSDEYDQNGVRIKNIGSNFKRKSYSKNGSQKKIIKDFQKTEKVVEEYGKDKGLHIFSSKYLIIQKRRTSRRL